MSTWEEIAGNLYRFQISAEAFYEIHVLNYELGTDFFEAKANLYVVGNWKDIRGRQYFQRDLLLSNHTVFECLDDAVEDYKKNVLNKE